MSKTKSNASLIAASGWIGTVAPVVFLLVLFTDGFLRPGYSPIRQYGSDLGLGWSLWWIFSVDVSIFGIMLFIFAAGLRQFFRPLLSRRRLEATTILLVFTGMGGIIAGVFSEAIPVGHATGGLLFFLSPTIAQLILGQKLRRLPDWRRYGTYTLINGVVFLILAFPFDIPAEVWAQTFGVVGLVQRVELVGIFGWFVITGQRFLAMDRGEKVAGVNT
jgi:hypothetical membrane protein